MAKIITENFKVETTNELFNSFISTNGAVGTNFATSLATYNTSSSLSLSSDNQTAITAFVSTQLASLKPESDYYIMGSSVDKANNISNTQFEKREFQRRVVFGNKVTDDDVRYMFNINAWTTGTIYDDFDDSQDTSIINMFVTITNPDEGNYYVYKCLSNNNAVASTVAPSLNVGVDGGVDASTYETVTSSDGYVWKYMFSVSNSDAQVFATTDSLPLPYPAYGDAAVKAAAKEDISQIIITNTPNSLFASCTFGPGTVDPVDDPTGIASASNVTLGAVEVNGTDTNKKSIVIKISPKTGNYLATANNFYTNLYLWRSDGRVFDIITSQVEDASDVFINVTVSTPQSKASFDDGSMTYKLLPKISVSRSESTGKPCIAYGIIDRFGTLVNVEFATSGASDVNVGAPKGTKYKHASATLLLPPGVAEAASISNLTPTSLRAVVSPTGGHGSNPINEMSMSRLAVITNFSGEDVLIPDSNYYTKVALLKNPTFSDGTKPTQFDNRTVITIADNVTSTAVVGSYITQSVALSGGTGTESETVIGRIHESVYDGSTNTLIYLVDYSGDFQNTYQSGDVYVRTTPTSTSGNPLSINNASTDVVYGKYSPYAGEILHFVDFDPIQRQADRKEKIKFIFDF